MNPFEFICVFYSVVLGVAVAQLMTGMGRLVEVRDHVRFYWVQSLWIVIVLLIDVSNWWGIWGLRSVKSWSIFSFLLLTFLLVAIYFMTVLVFPRIPEGETLIDIEMHYFRNRGIFFSATAASWALALICNWTLFPITSWRDSAIIVPLLVVVLSMVAAWTPNRTFHKAFAILSLINMLGTLIARSRIE